MACGESRGRRVLLCLGLLVVSSSFCHCTRLTRLKALGKLRGESTLSEGHDLRHGRLLIGQNSLQGGQLQETKATKHFLDVDTDYQADMGWGEPKQPQPQGVVSPRPDSAAVERLLKMDPKVECTGDSMTLQIQDAASTGRSPFFVDRGSRLSPLPLSMLPPSCGYTIRSTMRDLVLVAPYDGCFVSHEEDCYVLPLRWCGLPVRMSCPVMKQSSPNPPMVTCHAQGMVVKTGWTVPVAKMSINLTGNWEPLMKASPRCGFSVVIHPEGVVISVRYAPCMEKKDGMYTLHLAGEGETKISCPSLSPVQTENTKPTNVPKLQTESPSIEVYPSTPSPIKLIQATVPLVPTLPKNPEVPKGKPNPFLHYPYFYYPYPAYPNTKPTTTVQPSSKTVPPTKLPVTPKGQALIAEPSVQPPVTKQLNGQVKQPVYPYPFYVKPPNPDGVPPAYKPEQKLIPTSPPQVMQPPHGHRQQYYYPFPWLPSPSKPVEPPASQPEQLVPPKPPSFEEPQGQVQQPLYPFHFYPQPEPEKPTAAPRPPQPEAPQPEPEKPTAAPRPPQPEAPQPEPEKPAVAPRPPQPEIPWGQVQQPFYPFHFYLQPKPEKPTAAPRPPQPELPHPEPEKPTAVPRPPQPVAPQPEPEKPTAAPRPLQSVVQWGQVQRPFYPFHFYPQPEPEKPTAAPRPPQPELPQPEPEKPTAAPRPPQPVAPQPEPEKPAVAPRPPQPEIPWGYVQQPFYPFRFYPQPVPEKPTVAPRPPQPEAPQSEPEKPTAAPRPPQPEAPQPEPEKPTVAPRPPQPEIPWGYVQQPFYPFHLYPQPVPEKPTIAPRPPQPEVPRPEPEKPTAAPRPPQPDAPQPEPEKPTAAPRPPQPEIPWGHVQQPFYPFHFYPQPVPEKPAVAQMPPQPEAPQPEPEKPTAAPRPPQPEAPQPEPEKPAAVPRPPQPIVPWGQVQQPFYPFHFYPQPVPEKPTVAPSPPQPEPEKPTAAPRPPETEAPQPEPEKPAAAPWPPQPVAPWSHVQQPFYPFHFYPQLVPEKPIVAPRPPQPEAPQPEPETPVAAPGPQPVTLPPVTSTRQPQIVITHPNNQNSPSGGIVPQPPQSGSLYIPAVPYCPQICPSGFSNCCPQIAFHQHLHQIIPARVSSKEAPSLNPGLPFLPSLAYSGFGNGLGSAPLPQKPAEAMIMQPTTTAPISSQSLPSGNDNWPPLHPPDGNPAALLHYPNKPTNPEQPVYPYIVPNSLYSNWPYLPHNEELQILLQRQASAQRSVPSKPQTSSKEPVNQVLQYEPFNVQLRKQQNIQLSAGDMNNPPVSNFVPDISKYLQQLQIAPTVKDLQPSNNKASESEAQMQPEVQSELDRHLFPYYMLQDAEVQTHDKSNASQPQQLVSDSKKSTKRDQTMHSYSEPKSYVLLQHGPPGREPNSFNESPLPFRDLVRDENVFAQNLARHQSSKSQHPQNVYPPQKNPQHPKWLRKGMSYPLPDVNYMPGTGDKIRSHSDFWRPTTPLGSNQRIQLHVPGNAIQRRSSAADCQANGLNQPFQKEGGN